MKIGDDSACTVEVVGRRCPAGMPSVMCTGEPQQVAPPECDGSVAKQQPDAMTSTSPTPPEPMSTGSMSMMTPMTTTPSAQPSAPEPSCDPPSCCSSDNDCPGETAECESAAKCQGTRTQYHCRNHRCVEEQIDDDSVCEGRTSASCGTYKDRVCGREMSQQPAPCPMLCSNSQICSSGSTCVRYEVSGSELTQCVRNCRSESDCAANPNTSCTNPELNTNAYCLPQGHTWWQAVQ